MTPVRIAQYGTRHGHAEGKLAALKASADVALAGVFEPDAARRRALDRPGSAYQGVRWFADAEEMLGDPDLVAVASESLNEESLEQTTAIVRAGKHVWYDKPAGDDWRGWLALAEAARAGGRHVQMGYMFRYHHGFRQIAEWVQSGRLGEVFAIRAHMSTSISAEARRVIARHQGGIFYDLAGHMIDQVTWLLGRPSGVAAFFRQSDPAVPGFADNTVGVLEYERALSVIDIAAIETAPTARRFEVYGSLGSAILEPFEPAGALRLCLEAEGVTAVPVAAQSRQALYELELRAFVATLRGAAPDRTLEHEALVQETLLRTVAAGDPLRLAASPV